MLPAASRRAQTEFRDNNQLVLRQHPQGLEDDPGCTRGRAHGVQGAGNVRDGCAVYRARSSQRRR